MLDGAVLIIAASTGGGDNQQAGAATIMETLAQDPLWQHLNVVQQDQTDFVPDSWSQAESNYYAAQW